MSNRETILKGLQIRTANDAVITAILKTATFSVIETRAILRELIESTPFNLLEQTDLELRQNVVRYFYGDLCDKIRGLARETQYAGIVGAGIAERLHELADSLDWRAIR